MVPDFDFSDLFKNKNTSGTTKNMSGTTKIPRLGFRIFNFPGGPCWLLVGYLLATSRRPLVPDGPRDTRLFINKLLKRFSLVSDDDFSTNERQTVTTKRKVWYPDTSLVSKKLKAFDWFPN